jgi:exonuclease III
MMTWNANGIQGKLVELKVFLKMHDVDIMAIIETKLLKTDKIHFESHNILRKQRNTDTRGQRCSYFGETRHPSLQMK